MLQHTFRHTVAVYDATVVIRSLPCRTANVVGEQALDKAILEAAIKEKMLCPKRLGEAVRHVRRVLSVLRVGLPAFGATVIDLEHSTLVVLGDDDLPT